MALVKKLQPGGVVRDDKFEKFLEENSKNLTKQSYNIFSKEAQRLKDLYNSGKLQESFRIDDSGNKYITDLEGYSGLDSENNTITKNIFGKIKLNDEVAARSYLGSLVKSFYEANKQVTPEKEDLTPIQLENYILQNRFNNNEDVFAKEYGSLENEARWKNYLIPELKNYILHYKGLKPENVHKYTTELDEINSLISTEGFDKTKVVDLMNKVGLNSESLLLSDDDQKAWLENKTKEDETKREEDEKRLAAEKEKQTQLNQTAYITALKKAGIPDNVIQNAYESGYTSIDSNFKPQQTWLQNYLANNKNIVSLINESGKHVLISPSGFVNKDFTDVNDPSTFGYTITSDPNQGLFVETAEQAHKAGRRKFNFGIEQPRGAGLEKSFPESYRFNVSNLPEDLVSGFVSFKGYPVDKSGQENVRDVFGNLDYYRNIRAYRPSGEFVNFYRNPDGTYEYNGKNYNLNVQDTNSHYQYSDNKISTNDRISNEKALELYSKRNNGLTEDEIKQLSSWALRNSWNPKSREILLALKGKYKEGGVIKHYVGGNVKNIKTDKNQESKAQIKEIPVLKGTRLNDSSTKGILDKISAAGNLVMMIPGITGTIGGGIATAADLVNDLSDGLDWKDVGNLALNLGLTAASTVGLGAVAKGVTKGIKNLNKLEKIALKYEPEVAKTIQKLKTTGLDKADPADIKTVETFAKKVKGKTNLVNLPKINMNSKPMVVGSTILSGVTGGIAAGNLIEKAKSGETWTTDDISNIGTAGFGLRNVLGIRNIKNLKDPIAPIKRSVAKKYTKDITSEQHSITSTINDKPVTITGEKVDKFVKSKVNSKKTKNEIKEELVKEFKKQNPDTNVTIKDIKTFEPKTEVKVDSKFDESKYDFNKNLYLQRKARDWSKKYFKPEPVKTKVVEPEVKKVEPKVTKKAPVVKLEPKVKKEQAPIVKLKPEVTKKNIGGVIKLKKGDEVTFKLSTIPSSTLDPNVIPTPPKINISSEGALPTVNENKFLKVLTNIGQGVHENKDMLGDLAMYGYINKINNENARIQRGALAKQMMPGIELPRTVIDKSIPLLNDYSRAALGQRNLGSRIARSTSDINKSIGAQLEAESRANDIMLQGKDKLSSHILDVNARQAELDAAKREQNLKLNYSTLATNKAIASKIDLVSNNLNLQKVQNLYMLNDASKNFFAKKRYEKMYNTLANPDPLYKQSVEQYSKLLNKDYTGIQDYETWNKLTPEEKRNAGDVFEKSKYYSNVENTMKTLKDYIDNYQNSMYILRNKMSSGIYAKGGSLSAEDRVRIKREEGTQKKELETLRQYYKRLLKNEEFLQKAMINLFK